MNIDQVRRAAILTLDLCRKEAPHIAPAQWRGYETRPACAPEKKTDRIADAMWGLEQVSEFANECRPDDAFAILIRSQTLLWIAKLATRTTLDEINKTAEQSTATLA